jgi:small subunit ribosomal protein S4e
MVKNHLKRLNAPKTWAIQRKTQPFVTRPNPGSHTYDLCVSINTFLKEYTDIVHTTKETKYLLKNNDVYVNDTRVDDHKHQIGFLDVLDIPHADIHILVSVNNKAQLKALHHDEISERFDKITGKKHVKGGKTQLTTLNGETFLVDNDDHNTGSTLRFTKAQKSIKNVYEFKENAPAFIFRGKHAGKKGTLTEIRDDLIVLETEDETIQTKKDYTLITGNKRASIDL